MWDEAISANGGAKEEDALEPITHLIVICMYVSYLFGHQNHALSTPIGFCFSQSL